MADQDQGTGTMVRGLVLDGAARMLWVEAGQVAQEMATRHGLTGMAARTAAEGVVANLLMSAYIKGDERVTLQVQSEHPRAAFTGEVDAEGAFRGWLSPVQLSGPGVPSADQPGVLRGVMMVIKSTAKKELYRAATPIEDETLGQALHQHLHQSAQVRDVLRIEATLAADGTVASARGVVVEHLPPEPGRPSVTEAEFLAAFESLLQADLGEQATSVAFGSLMGHAIEVLEVRGLRWSCRCSLDKVESTLFGLGPKVLQELLDEDGQAEVRCHFCDSSRLVSGRRLAELIAGHAMGTIDA